MPTPPVEAIADELAGWLTEHNLQTVDILYGCSMGGRLQYWYGDKEAKVRAWDIKYIKSNFPCTEFVELKDMGHASMASLYPKEMAARLERLAEG